MERATGRLAARKTMVVKDDFHKELVMATLLHAHPHPHVLSPWAVVPDVPAVIWEFCDESLHDRWRRQAGIFGVDMIRRLMRHCLRGLDHLHRTCRVLHRDIKPSNLMLRAETSSGIVLKIADFWWCTAPQSDDDMALGTMERTPGAATPAYRAPELCLQAPSYGPAVDVWSTGVVLRELLTGLRLWEMEPHVAGNIEAHCLTIAMALAGPITEASWPGCSAFPGWRAPPPTLQRLGPRDPAWRRVPILAGPGEDLADQLVALKPENRPSPAEALCSPFFQVSERRGARRPIRAKVPECLLATPWTEARARTKQATTNTAGANTSLLEAPAQAPRSSTEQVELAQSRLGPQSPAWKAATLAHGGSVAGSESGAGTGEHSCQCAYNCGSKNTHQATPDGAWPPRCRNQAPTDSQFCHSCRCSVPGCPRVRYKSSCCWNHQGFLPELSLELHAMALFQETLVGLFPVDLEEHPRTYGDVRVGCIHERN